MKSYFIDYQNNNINNINIKIPKEKEIKNQKKIKKRKKKMKKKKIKSKKKIKRNIILYLSYI
jgi:hypothetical protein